MNLSCPHHNESGAEQPELNRIDIEAAGPPDTPVLPTGLRNRAASATKASETIYDGQL